MRALDISSNFVWNFINHMIIFCVSFIIFGVAKQLVEKKLEVVRQIVPKNPQEEEAKLDRLDELELKDIKTERFFMHNFWMRAF